VNPTTLTDLLREIRVPEIDLLTLDVEALAAEVLDGFQFLPRSRVLIIETRAVDSEKIAERLLVRGYALGANFSNFDSQTRPRWSCGHQDSVWETSDEKDIIAHVSS
jgi:hypothetical protein